MPLETPRSVSTRVSTPTGYVSSNNPDPQASGDGPRRASLACVGCRKGKAKCVPVDTTNVCQECEKRGRECVWVESNRGKWSRAPKGRKSVAKEACRTWQTLSQRPGTPITSTVVPSRPASSTGMPTVATSSALSEGVVDLHNPVHFKIDSALFPLGVLAESSQQIESNLNSDIEFNPKSPGRINGRESGELRWMPSELVGVANTRYFRGDLHHQLMPQGTANSSPSILADRIITDGQAEELFKIYFDLLNPQLGLLDPRFTTAQSCSLRSHFLFESICAVAARFYRNGILYHVLLQHARKIGLEAMVKTKCTATVQGFVILSTWSQQVETYSTDNAYLYAGIAIRMGIEIGLHRKTVLRYPEHMEASIRQVYTAEVLSRERTWLCIFCLDRTMSALNGKPPQAPETYSLRDVDDWWQRPECLLSDVFISAMTQLLRLLYRCLDVIYSSNDTSAGVSTGLNYQIVVKHLQWRMDEWAQTWTRNLSSSYSEHGKKGPLELYLAHLRLFRSFYSLVPLSFGLHYCSIENPSGVDQISFVTRCYECAVGTLQTVTSDFSPDTVFKTLPDNAVVAVAYAACFLLKLIGPEFSHLFSGASVLDLVGKTVTLFKDASEDDRHIHYLYSLFLAKHVAAHRARVALGLGQRQTMPAETLGTQANSFLLTQPMVDMQNTDISIELDGSVNFTSVTGVDIFRPSEDMSSEWIDCVLGIQNRRNDPFSTLFQTSREDMNGHEYGT